MPFREKYKSEKGYVGVGIDVTEKCNRACLTCYMVRAPRNMSNEVFYSIIDQAEAVGFKELYLLGGEPTLHPDLFNFIDYAKDKFQLVILVSNMDRLSDLEFCKKVEKTGVTIAGQKHVVRNSAENKAIEELLTGGKHCETSMQAWENVQKIFPRERVCVQCCITKPVVESGNIYEVFRYARLNGFEPIMEFTKEGGEFKRNGKYDVSSSVIKKIFEDFIQIDQREFALSGADFISPQAYGKTCHMIEDSIHFLVDGKAVPCVGHHDYTLGDIKRESLTDILSAPLRKAMISPKNWIYGYCRDECQLFEQCTGGCRGAALDQTGCPRSSFYYCPNIPHDRLTLKDMIPPSCSGCILEENPICSPKK